jgi:hypothetical protein
MSDEMVATWVLACRNRRPAASTWGLVRSVKPRAGAFAVVGATRDRDCCKRRRIAGKGRRRDPVLFDSVVASIDAVRAWLSVLLIAGSVAALAAAFAAVSVVAGAIK